VSRRFTQPSLQDATIKYQRRFIPFTM